MAWSMSQHCDTPIDVYNRIDNQIDMGKYKGGYFDECFIYVRMDSMTGSIAKDWSFANGKFYNNNGTIVGASPWVNGKMVHCLDFDGTDDYIRITDNDSLTGMANLSIEVWIYSDRQDYNGYAVGKEDAAGQYSYMFQMHSSNNGRWRYHVKGVAAEVSLYSTLDPVPSGQWFHIVGVYDGSFLIIYIDGAENNRAAAVLGNVFNSTADVGIGARMVAGVDREFDGRIDEVRLYTRVLTPYEVRKRYEIGRNARIPPS